VSALSESNRQRLVAYLRRIAPYHAADPVDWLFRVKAGEAVKRRAAQGPRKGRVVPLKAWTRLNA
jgi:hypothetical protein